MLVECSIRGCGFNNGAGFCAAQFVKINERGICATGLKVSNMGAQLRYKEVQHQRPVVVLEN